MTLEKSKNKARRVYLYGFNGKLKDDNVYGKGNFYNYGFRMYDSRLGQFLSVDPLAKKYASWTPYAFAQDRVIDGIDLEGKEWQNYEAHFKAPGELKIKLPNEKTAQSQIYSIVIANSKMSFADFKKSFAKAPQNYLSNKEATFNAPVNGKGESSTFKQGSYIKIDIKGIPYGNYVKVLKLNKSQPDKLSAGFVTMEGHIEKGIIVFQLSQEKNGDIKFSINSMSNVDYGMAPEGYAREKQQKSWKEVLNNVSKKLGGNEVSRKVKITDPTNKKEKDNK